jgi:transcriptional regulator with XRE-family HTH domain
MIAPASPMVRRRRLAAELREIRESRGRSGESVARALRWSPSKVSRYERARTGLRPQEVERLLDYYQITGARRDQLLSLAEDAAQKGWWEELGDNLSETYQQFIALEHEAASMEVWHVDVVTGLLQTEGYARHIIGSYGRVEPLAPSMVGRMVGVRMRRQQVLEREGLQLSVVLDESVLRRRIGTDAVMYAQLRYLAEIADRPNVTLQVLPLDAQHAIFGESFVIFGIGQDGTGTGTGTGAGTGASAGAGDDAVLQDVVSTEHMISGSTFEGERETYLYRIAFDMLSGAALDPIASKDVILETAESCWSGAWQRASA